MPPPEIVLFQLPFAYILGGSMRGVRAFMQARVRLAGSVALIGRKNSGLKRACTRVANVT